MTTKENTPVAAPEVQEQLTEEQPQATAELTMADLTALKAIVDVACQRGAFKAPEMEMVGKTFNKLNSFLEAAAKNAQPEGQE
jgi:hypothetical protein